MRKTTFVMLIVVSIYALSGFLNVNIRILYRHIRNMLITAHDLGLGFGTKEEELALFDNLMEVLEWYLDTSLAVATYLTTFLLMSILFYYIVLCFVVLLIDCL